MNQEMKDYKEHILISLFPSKSDYERKMPTRNVMLICGRLTYKTDLIVYVEKKQQFI